MKINTDLSILGGLPDFGLVNVFLERRNSAESVSSLTKIRTEKSIKRFELAIKSTFLTFQSVNQKLLVKDVLLTEGITDDSLLMLFWNASFNNDLLNLINSDVFFPAFYSGRVVVKRAEITAYINELKTKEKELRKWSESTIETTASKYLTLLKKFNLLEGSANKTIVHPYLNDKMFVFFIYWLTAIEEKANVLKSRWLQYSFSETEFFVERAMQKKFSKFIDVIYTGDKLQIRPLIPYTDIYYAVHQS